MNAIGKLLPVDGYITSLNKPLPVDYTASLTHLYQPLIGMQAVMLYQTLLEDSRIHAKDTPQTHHTLMSYLNIPLDDIYRARLKLEGIGLLETYQLQDDETNYLYEILPPFSPDIFFNDAMLAQLLMHHVGTDRYRHLQAGFKPQETVNKGDHITASFQDVFQTFTTVSNTPDTAESSEPAGRSSQNESIDFSWLQQMLKQRMISPKEVLSADNKKLISQMMSLYSLPQHDIEKALLWSLDEDNKLEAEEFKDACHDLFKTSYPDTQVQLAEKQSGAAVVNQTNAQPESKEEQLIQRMESMSPKELLEDFSSGQQASDQDMKIIQDVMTKQRLTAPVMNVLIHYVLLKSNMKLSRNYLEKIASHWSRAKLSNAREAMDFAKQQLNRTDKQNAQKAYKKRYSQEVVPEWFKNRHKKQEKNTEETSQDDHSNSEDKEELAELLRAFSQGSNK